MQYIETVLKQDGFVNLGNKWQKENIVFWKDNLGYFTMQKELKKYGFLHNCYVVWAKEQQCSDEIQIVLKYMNSL